MGRYLSFLFLASGFLCLSTQAYGVCPITYDVVSQCASQFDAMNANCDPLDPHYANTRSTWESFCTNIYYDDIVDGDPYDPWVPDADNFIDGCTDFELGRQCRRTTQNFLDCKTCTKKSNEPGRWPDDYSPTSPVNIERNSIE